MGWNERIIIVIIIIINYSSYHFGSTKAS